MVEILAEHSRGIQPHQPCGEVAFEEPQIDSSNQAVKQRKPGDPDSFIRYLAGT